MKKIIYFSAIPIVSFILILMIPLVLQKNIIFQPVTLPQSHAFQFEYPFEEHFVAMPDGVRINYLYFKSKMPRKGVVLYFHGNADNLQRWGKYHTDFTHRGYDFMIMDYRQYGKSEGVADEEKFYADAKTLYDLLLKTATPQEIIIYGRSLGSAVASNLAARVPAKMLILETPFDNMQHLFELQTRWAKIPIKLKYHFKNDQHIQQVPYPILIFHGTADWVVPYESAKKLTPYLKSSDEFITIEKGSHRNLGTYPQFQEKLDKWLGRRE